MRRRAGTWRRRSEKIVSSITLSPRAVLSAAITGACASVGKPGYGAVRMGLTARQRGQVTHRAFSVSRRMQPPRAKTSVTARRSDGHEPQSSSSPRVAAAMDRKVAVSMRSGITVCSAPCSGFFPATRSTDVPSPRICAPQARRNRIRSQISGSLAALQSTVSPSAPSAASSRFSVAPTLGIGRAIVQPRRRPAVQRTHSPCPAQCAPSRRRPRRCRSIGRSPRTQPPG